MGRFRDPQQIQNDIDAAEDKAERTKFELEALTRTVADDMTDGQIQRAERLMNGHDKAAEQLKGLRAELREALRREDQRVLLRSKASDRRNTENGDGAAPYDSRTRGRDTGAGDVVRSKALRLIDDLSAHDELGRSVLTPRVGDHLDRLIRRDDEDFDGSVLARRILLTENDAYRSAFHKYLRTTMSGQPLVLSSAEADAVAQLQEFELRRAMSENTTTAGGFGVPSIIDPSIIITSGAADVPILKYCRIEQVTNNVWRGVSSAGMSWSYSTEGTEASDNSPVLAQPTAVIHMAKGFIPYSIEVSADYSNFAGEMGVLLDSGYQDLLATKTMTGSGTNEPFGIFVALDASTFDEVTTTTDGQFGGADIFKVWNSLGERYRSKAAWVMSVSVQSSIRQFAATQSSTSAYFTIDMTAGEFRINDRPVILTDYAPSFSGAIPGTTGAANILAVGSWRDSYVFAQRAGMSVEAVPLLLGSNRRPDGTRGLFAWARNGANIINNLGAKVLQNQ